jgi:hypothetical protein
MQIAYAFRSQMEGIERSQGWEWQRRSHKTLEPDV